MKITELAAKCGFETIVPAAEDHDVSAAYASDLLSDVMANCPGDSVLVTVQNHKNTVAVCTLTGAVAIVICHGREVPADMSEAASAEKVAIFRSGMGQFEVSIAVAKALGL